MARKVSRREFVGGAVALGAGIAAMPGLARAAGQAAAPGVWLAGDLHCHTVYSHDVWSPNGPGDTNPQDIYTFGWTPAEQIAIAESRGLDFLAITDHDKVDALTDPGYRSLTGRLTLIPGYEHSLSGGHAGCLGVSQVMIDPATGQKIDTGSDQGAQNLIDAVRAAGGTFILNHPYYTSDGSAMWKKSIDVRPDSIEVWNISWPYRVPGGVSSLPTATSNNYESLPFWERYLDRWGRMPANGGSDNHWRATTAAQGVGQPTTWVYARDRSWGAILDAIKGGRTVVCATPPLLGGARLTMTAQQNGLDYIVGDTLEKGAHGTLVVRVQNAPGHTLKLVVDGKDADVVPVTSNDFTYTVILYPTPKETGLSPAMRVRAEVYLDEGYWMGALSSPIYFA